VGAGNYAYGGTTGGNLVVLSGAPWVTATTVSPGPFATGDTVPLTITSDTAGDVTVRVGGTLTAPGGIVAETTIDAGETLDLDVDVTTSFGEGVNRVWVFVRGAPDAGEGVRVDLGPARHPNFIINLIFDRLALLVGHVRRVQNEELVAEEYFLLSSHWPWSWQ
jgi:predicted RNA-binding protein with TRAM domain